MINVDSVAVKNVGDVRVLYVMATQAEYLEALKARFQPLICQVGPVEAALHMAAFLTQHREVDLVISLGSAGSSRLEQAQVYQVSSVAYRDMDASPFGFPKGVTPFSDLPAEIELGMPVQGVPSASISTGANVVSGDAYAGVEQDMVDMETWAILRACQVAKVPLIGLRGISDGAHPVAEFNDWTRYLSVIDQRLADVVDQIESALGQGHLVPRLPQG